MSKASIRASLEKHPILAGAGIGCVDEVLDAGLVRSYAPGEFLSREGQKAWAYWFLLSGSVRVFYTSPDGDEITVKLFAAPAAWAEMQVLHDYIHTEDCVATEPATVLCLPKTHFERILDAHPRFMKTVLLDAGARFLIATQHERALAFLTLPQRLAYLLLSYARLYGVVVDDVVVIRTRLSQNDLALGLGASRKSVARAFQEWKQNGLIGRRGRYTAVRNVEALTALLPDNLLGIDWVSGRKLAMEPPVSEREETPTRKKR